MLKRLFLVHFIVLSLSSVLYAADEKSKKGPPKFAKPVVTALAKNTLLAPTIKVPGTVVSRQQALIPAEVDGKLLWVADVGAQIKKGNPIARLDDTLYKLQASENKASLKQTETRITYLEKEVHRLKELEKSDFSSKTELDKVQLDLDLARSELIVAKTRVALDKETLDRYQVRAPYDGIVIERNKREGEWVNGGDTLATFSNPSALEIEARVTEDSIRYLHPGDKLKVYYRDKIDQGMVRAIVKVGDALSHMFDIRVDIHNDWLAGQIVKLEVPTGQSREVLAIPRDALILRRSGISVFTVGQNNQVQKIDVTTGIASSDLIEVKGDIKVGDTVVTRGSERLRPGQEVRIIPGR
ncbi:MAG: efflux RND transporter periplasmic adaptor subunit [Gammaproteobacteria bacterium]|nr:efflux RND transporter periplasmic adaptor subunit [Gammaproteobacteria bacterium]